MRYLVAVLTCLLISSALAQDTKKPKETKPDDIILTINKPTEAILTIKGDGTVTFGPGMSMNEAAREFWKRVGTFAPCANKED